MKKTLKYYYKYILLIVINIWLIVSISNITAIYLINDNLSFKINLIITILALIGLILVTQLYKILSQRELKENQSSVLSSNLDNQNIDSNQIGVYEYVIFALCLAFYWCVSCLALKKYPLNVESIFECFLKEGVARIISYTIVFYIFNIISNFIKRIKNLFFNKMGK